MGNIHKIRGENQPMSENKEQIQVALRLDGELAKKVKEEAKREERSYAFILRKAVAQYLAEKYTP